jgi:peptidoglycan/LPS O-acetylase OafA/YrhL
VRGVADTADGAAAPADGSAARHPWQRGRIAGAVAALALLVAAGAIAFLPYDGHVTHGTTTRSIACGTPYHERTAPNPVAGFFRYLIGQAAQKDKSASASERNRSGGAAPAPAPAVPTELVPGADHYVACHGSAQARMGLATGLGIAGVVGVAVLFVTWPVRREKHHERSRRLGYQPALDGLRALSIIVVMLFHAGLATRFVAPGYLGVGAFFVLSGFLITTLVLDEQKRWERVSLRHFYARRALRLLPLIIVAVLVGLLLHLVMSSDVARPNGSSLVGTAFYFSNWVAYFHPGSLGILDHTWSLAIEEQFYLIWPPLLVFLFARHIRRGRLIAFTAALCAASALYRALLWRHAVSWRPTGAANPTEAASLIFHHLDSEWNHWYVSSFTRADALLVGCLAAIVISTMFTMNTRGRRTLRTLTAFAIVAVALVYWNTAKPGVQFPSFLPEWGLLLFSAGIAVVIAAVVFEPASMLGRSLSVRPLTWVGRRSYGMYVIHWPVIILLGRYLHFGQWNVAITIGITVILAALSYRYLESPLLRMKGRYSRTGAPDAGGSAGTPAPAPQGARPEVVPS